MVIAKILGGLGNQLNAYACGYSIAKHLGQELVLDVSDYVNLGYFRSYCLDKLRIGSRRKLIYPPVSLGFLDPNGIPEELKNRGFRIIKHEDYPTRAELLTAVEGAENVFLLGYGGLEYCTPEDQKELQNQFQLKVPSQAVGQFRERICSEYSVAVHLRRTDFLEIGRLTADTYFQAGITYVKMFYPDAHFYFFSDDIQYAKDHFGSHKNYHYVHLLGGMDADLDEFFCLSACNGRILTRQSTFSFWAAALSQSENQINLCQENQAQEWGYNKQVCLDKATVDTLSLQYQPKERDSAPLPAVNDTVLQLLSEERNDEAIDKINQVCFDSYDLSESDMKELTTFKAIALAQKGSAGLPAALRTFYLQMQTENEDPMLHANYFRALYQSSRVSESAIHAALANRFGDTEDYQIFFAQTEPFEQKLYQLLLNKPVRHFIFIPIEGWNFYIAYTKTLAAFLARMGQKVTFLQPTNAVVGEEVSDRVAAQYAVEHINICDSLYRYHIDLVPCLFKEGANGRKSLFHELVQQCAKRFDLPAVVVTSHPDVFSEPAVPGIKYIVPDILDPLNRERFIVGGGNLSIEDYVTYMAKRADTMFLSGPLLKKMKKLFGNKIRPAYPAWEGPTCQILNLELDFSPNYIASEQILRNAVALLEV